MPRNSQYKFILLQTALPQLEEIIRGYLKANHNVTSFKLSDFTHNSIYPQAISGSVTFLKNCGILLQDTSERNKYGLSALGLKLGQAIDRKSAAEIGKYWGKVVTNTNFLITVYNSISFIGVTHQTKIWLDIVSQAYGENELNRGAKKHELRGAKTICDILEKAGLINKIRIKRKFFIRASENNTSIEAYKNLVFVIMAMTPSMEPIFKGIQNAAKCFDLDAKRVVDVEGDIRITDEIIKMINAAEIIVADLSHERPNVYFELGYARGKNKTIITLAREGTVIHFDVKDWRYIPYTDSRIVEQELVKRFEKVLSKIYKE